MDKELKIIIVTLVLFWSLLHAVHKLYFEKSQYDVCAPKSAVDMMPTTLAVCYAFLPFSLWGKSDVGSSELPR